MLPTFQLGKSFTIDFQAGKRDKYALWQWISPISVKFLLMVAYECSRKIQSEVFNQETNLQRDLLLHKACQVDDGMALVAHPKYPHVNARSSFQQLSQVKQSIGTVSLII